MPSPIPPISPYPTMTSQYWPSHTPSAETRKPVEKQTVEMNIAQRGPLRSTAVPNTAADTPSITIPSVNGRAVKRAGRRISLEHRGRKGVLENAPGVGLPDREVDRQSRGRDQPPAPAGGRDDALTLQETGGHGSSLATTSNTTA